MKLSGIAGTGSGKLGSQVYASVAGEQVVRNYQPKVSNPSTTKQVNQRARMKLMSQLAAAMASVIAIPRQGMKSSRNLFTKKNIALAQAAGGQAFAFLEGFQLTTGSTALPRVEITREDAGDDTTKLVVNLRDNGTAVADRVVYNVFARSEEGELMLIHSTVCEDPGDDGDFAVEFDDYEGDLFVYAYGMKDGNARAKASYGNYTVESGEDIAKLIMNRTLSTSDYNFTETQGNSIEVGANSGLEVPEGKVAVRFVIVGDGAVHTNSAAGAVQTSPKVVNRGTQLKWYVTTPSGYDFQYWGWYEGNGVWNTSHENPFTFTAWGDIYLYVITDDHTGNLGDVD